MTKNSRILLFLSFVLVGFVSLCYLNFSKHCVDSQTHISKEMVVAFDSSGHEDNHEPLSHCWHEHPCCTLAVLKAVASIDPHLYERASLDSFYKDNYKGAFLFSPFEPPKV